MNQHGSSSREKIKTTNPKTSGGQVHPTARSRLPRKANINAIRFSINPKVTPRCHFGNIGSTLLFSANCRVGPIRFKEQRASSREFHSRLESAQN
jgi:hypothetical protein